MALLHQRSESGLALQACQDCRIFNGPTRVAQIAHSTLAQNPVEVTVAEDKAQFANAQIRYFRGVSRYPPGRKKREAKIVSRKNDLAIQEVAVLSRVSTARFADQPHAQRELPVLECVSAADKYPNP